MVSAAVADVPYIHCEDLFKIYKTEEIEVVALRSLDLRVARGEMMAIVGASGSGKTTLLNILAGARPTLRRTGPRRRPRPADGYRRGPGALPPLRGRLRVAAGRAQPGPVPGRAAERGSADDPRGHVAARWAATRGPAAGARRPSGQAAKPPRPALRRRATARGDRCRAGERTPRCCWPTSPPANWTARPRIRCTASSARSTRRWA